MSNQTLVVLESLQDLHAHSPNLLPPSRIQAIGQAYSLVPSRNIELQSAYYKLALQARDESCYDGVVDLLGKVGRMKFVRPLFRGLKEVDEGLARRTYERYREFYHPICRGMVEKDLGLA